MNPPPRHDPNAALNQVLSEVIDLVQDVKQAHRKVSETHTLHAELDRLFEDLASWARVLLARDEALGLSPLAMMPSVAGRRPPNLWPGSPDDDEVRHIVSEHLGRLEQHLVEALAEQDDEESRATLASLQEGLVAHQRRLAGP